MVNDKFDQEFVVFHLRYDHTAEIKIGWILRTLRIKNRIKVADQKPNKSYGSKTD